MSYDLFLERQLRAHQAPYDADEIAYEKWCQEMPPDDLALLDRLEADGFIDTFEVWQKWVGDESCKNGWRGVPDLSVLPLSHITDLSGADLRGANLSGADLSKADLSWSARGDNNGND